MGKNKSKGGKGHRKGKHEDTSKKELLLKGDGQEYGQVTKMLGNGRLECHLLNLNKSILCTIRGSMRKRVWINQGDIVLVSLREFQNDKADIMHKYNHGDVRTLQQKGLIPNNIIIDDNYKDNDLVEFTKMPIEDDSDNEENEEGTYVPLQPAQKPLPNYDDYTSSSIEDYDITKL
jgi:translation initiation factor 1A